MKVSEDVGRKVSDTPARRKRAGDERYSQLEVKVDVPMVAAVMIHVVNRNLEVRQ